MVFMSEAAPLAPAFKREAEREEKARRKWQHTAETASQLLAKRKFSSSMEFLMVLSVEANVSRAIAKRVYADLNGRVNPDTGCVELAKQ